jgi:small subunit ribosomal protein S16
MVKIRLSRLGKKNDPFYRIVAIDSRLKREGIALDILGHWHPRTKVKKIDKKKVEEWVSKGAQISLGVKKLLA